MTISDPYYTDETNVFDLTGLSANLSCAWIQPDEARPVLSVVSEARDMETAQEICDVFSRLFLDSLNEQ